MRRVLRSCRGMLYRLLYPRPSNTAPLWVRHTYAFSQGKLPPDSAIYKALDELNNKTDGSCDTFGPVPPMFVPFHGTLEDYEEKLRQSRGGVLVLAHLREWDGGTPSPRGGKRRGALPNAEGGLSPVAGAGTLPLHDAEETPTSAPPSSLANASSDAGSEAAASSTQVECWAMNVVEHVRIAGLYDIRFVPTWLGYRHGRLVGRVEGGFERDLLALLHKVQNYTSTAEEEDMMDSEVSEVEGEDSIS